MATYTYNGRHLVNDITYAAPSGITPTDKVTFAYDAAGNRSSMTQRDAANNVSGGVDYGYDQLSSLLYENRLIAGISNSMAADGKYKISYEYNLLGQLKKLTDPFNSRVDYGYDAAGRLNALTGVNASTVPLITGIEYRAFGSARQITYANGRVATFSYNQRLAVSHLEIPGVPSFPNIVMSIDYQYYDDGRLKYSHDTEDNRLDRGYGYDSAARLTLGLSGPEARGEADTTNRPYRETFGYDAFNHLTDRTTKHWSKPPPIYGSHDTYTNNRRVGWSYDADGNLVNDFRRQYSYDAAGRLTALTSTNYSFNQYFDGDGRQIKTVEPNYPLYFVPSTVLGGRIIANLDRSGNKLGGTVYSSSGEHLASQAGNGATMSVAHTDPSGIKSGSSSVVPIAEGFGYVSEELDPVGAEVFGWDPYPEFSDPGDSGFGRGNVTDPSRGCKIFGISIPCDWLMPFSFSHIRRVTDIEQTPPVFSTSPITVGQILREGINGTPLARLFPTVEGVGRFITPTFFQNPQKSGERRVSKDEYLALRKEMAKALQSEKCRDFIDKLIGYDFGAPYDSSEDFLALSDYIYNSSDGGVF
ncbi:MAG TPA: hypothetical protein VN643_21605 [Pyrinomonadaceae bacterium]|nr:hypothetical protein [Pyrinomonadaceae bacterium]